MIPHPRSPNGWLDQSKLNVMERTAPVLMPRILAHAGVGGVSDQQLAAVITPCAGSARQITDAVAQLALTVRRASQCSVVLHDA